MIAIIERDEIRYVDEGDARIDAKRLTPTDVPRRYDLPVGHPLRGRRALRVVPAGMPDCTVDDQGRLVPIDAPAVIAPERDRTP